MYDNTVVETLTGEEAVKFMIESNMNVGAVKGNIIFGNGNFKMSPDTNNGPISSQNGMMYKQVCLSIDPVGVTGAQNVVLGYFTQSPNVTLFSEVADAAQFYIAQSSEANTYFTPGQAENAINLYTPLIAGRYVQLVIFNNFGNNGGNKYIIIDANGRTVEDINKEWKALIKNTSHCVIGDARMALYRLIQKAQYISGGNDQLIILNDAASIQYNVTLTDGDGCESWETVHYAILSIKGEKYYCSNETDLLTQFNKYLHLIEV